MNKKLYQEFAARIGARIICIAEGNTEWEVKHQDVCQDLTRELMPCGSGIDNGTTIDIDDSSNNKLVFRMAYHHMNEGGYYDGWSEHSIIVMPDLASGFTLRITGRDRNQIKEYLYDVYSYALGRVIEWDAEKKRYKFVKE